MRHKPDEFSSHEYEVKNLYMEGSSFKTVFFYLQAGEPVNIEIESILKKTNIWVEPTKSEPQLDYHIFFEVRPEKEVGIVDLYLSKFTVTIQGDKS